MLQKRRGVSVQGPRTIYNEAAAVPTEADALLNLTITEESLAGYV